MLLDPAGMRQDYDQGGLTKAMVDPDPIMQFEAWFKEAVQSDLKEPNAMALATVSADGQPSVRMVLMKGFDHQGFTFFTNYQSRKGEELAGNSSVSLMFWWDRMHRQVRIEGKAELLAAEASDAYFSSRPYGSRIGAAASPQSEVIEAREILIQRFSEMRAAYPENLPRPKNWGGYLVVPTQFEFWQGQRSRLHDRIRYRTGDDGWAIERLAP